MWVAGGSSDPSALAAGLYLEKTNPHPNEKVNHPLPSPYHVMPNGFHLIDPNNL